MKSLLLLFYISTGCFALSFSADGNEYHPYLWIEQDKMRAGYLYYYDPVSNIDLVKELGLNTIILKCWKFSTAEERLNTIKSIREWAKAAKENDLHLFIGLNWQPYPRTQGVGYELIVYEDGAKGVAVDPFDDKFWSAQINEIFLLIANLSVQPGIRIDGIFLDMEIYGSEKEPHIKKNYFEKSCGFGDNSFSQYLIYKKYQPSQFPAIEKKDRKDWLADKNILDDYFIFLRKQVLAKAITLRESIHKINSEFLMGIYPHPEKNNWVQYPLAQGFSSEKMPLVVFGTHSYGYFLDKNGDGYTFVPKDIKNRYAADGINSLYCAGFLFRKYKGETLERNLSKSIENWDGYWLYSIHQLRKDEIILLVVKN